MKAFGDKHGYQTMGERKWDGRDQARPSADPVTVVDYTPDRFDYEAWHKRMRAEDLTFAKGLAFATFLLGAGIGFIVGVWVATH